MAGEVLCPKCGTVSPTETRVCPRCGTTLSGGSEATSKSKALSSVRPKPVTRRAPDASMGATAPDDTMMEHEEKAATEPEKPAVKKAVARPATGPVPQAGRNPEPRRSNPAGATGTSSRDSLIGKKLQEYVIEARLGVGGMGVVYKATHQMIGKAVAIKVLRPDIVQDPRDMDRLLDEARIISSIKNRGIINIFGAGTLEDGRNYLIMELLEGEALEQLMQREGKVPAGDAVIILEQVLSALSAAHEAGVVHRDLKPANVFLVKETNLFYVKLLDFGLARRNQQNVTRIAGTPDYISPEHARGRPAGPPADLYAFGVLCFHMLTGQLPFIGTTPMEVMEKHVHSAPPIPHEINKEIPKALSELILKLLAKEPGERPDAVQVKADLRAATKQMRNAATMMSLMAIDPVVDSKEGKGEEKKRARELAVSAQVADLKRKVTRRWPIVLGAVVAVWFVAVLAYVMWPASPTPVAPVGKKGPKELPKDPPLKPLKNPMLATNVDPPKTNPAGTDPVVKQNDPVVKVDPPVGVDPSVEVDAGEEPVLDENRDLPLDDVRLGEKKRAKRIDITLDDMQAVMKQDTDRAEYFEKPFKRVQKICDEASTLRQLDNCEDELSKLSERFYKQ
jgi:eukaryotic-like serine/threonine-protein kinase